MTTRTPKQHSKFVSTMQAKVEHIEQVQIPDLITEARRCKAEGRYATASGFYWLVRDLERDIEAYRRSIDWHLGEIVKGE